MRRRRPLLAAAALAAVCAGCGGSSTPATGSPTPQPTPGRSRGSVMGEIVAIHGTTTTVETPDGSDARFTVDPDTAVTQQAIADVSDLIAGGCAFATGARDVRGYVVAVRVLITAHGPNGCSRPGAGLTLGGSRRTGGAAGGLAVAGGEITAVNGMVVTVMGGSGADHFTAGPTTPVSRLVAADLTTLGTGLCVLARGIPAEAGEVEARSISIVPASVGGCFASGAGGGAAAGGRASRR
jgi:hypothetical protein